MSEKVRGSPSQPVDRRGHEVQQAKGSLSHNFLKLPRDIFYIQIKGASLTIFKLPRDIFCIKIKGASRKIFKLPRDIFYIKIKGASRTIF